jgi:glycerol uptake facilitator-like aquaporin
MPQKLVAEFFGTTTLAFAILASLSIPTPLISTPIVAGLVLMLFVYSISAISGSHLNPAVTVGAWAIRKIPTKEAMLYIAVQCLGGFAAYILAFNLFTGVTVEGGLVPESYTDFFAELIGMVVFSFGIASVIYKKTNETASGLVIGGSLTLGILLAIAAGSAGILNPAVGIAIGTVSLSNIAGALLGSIIGMHLYRHLVR